MDNKKWYKKFATIFWWSFTILPLLVALIYFIGYHLTFNSGIATATELVSYHSNSVGQFFGILENTLNDFDLFTITVLKNTFTGMFNILGVTNYNLLGVFFGYMLSVALYHLMFDFLIFFINMIHSFLDINKERLF